MAENSSSSPATDAPIVISSESEDAASADTRHSQRRKTQKLNTESSGGEDADMGVGAASSGALPHDILAVEFRGQPSGHPGVASGVLAPPTVAVPNGISDMTNTTNQTIDLVTGLPVATRHDTYPQTMGSPFAQSHCRLIAD